MKRSSKLFLGVGIVLVIAAAVLIPLWQLGYFSPKKASSSKPTPLGPGGTHITPLGPGGIPSSKLTCTAVDNLIFKLNDARTATVTIAVPYGLCNGASLNYRVIFDSALVYKGQMTFAGSSSVATDEITFEQQLTPGTHTGIIEVYDSINHVIYSKPLSVMV